MTGIEFESYFTGLVRSERKITHEVLVGIREGEQRRHFLDLGFANAYDWLIRGHGYSQAAAHRRIQASRLLRDIPELAEDLKAGEVNLTSLTQMSSSLKNEEKRTGQKVPAVRKQKIAQQIKGKTTAETSKILAKEFPEAKKKQESFRPTKDGFRLDAEVSDEGAANLKRALELLSHSHPNMSMQELVEYLAAYFVKREERTREKRKMTRKDPVRESSRVSALVEREVRKRAGDACEYVDPISGRRCGSRYQVQIDHLQPLAMGGSNDLENLRCLCRNHNFRMAEKAFGERHMSRYRASFG